MGLTGMKSAGRRPLLLVPTLAFVLLGAVAAGAGPGWADGPDRSVQQRVTALDDEIPPEVGVTNCVGGAQEASLVRMNDTPTTIGETGVFVALTDAHVPVTVPANDADQLLVRFTGDVTLTGQLPLVLPADRVELQVLLDGVPMLPLNDLTFTTVIGEANGTQACRRVGPGAHQVEVQWRIVDEFMFDALNATMDNWLLSVEVND